MQCDQTDNHSIAKFGWMSVKAFVPIPLPQRPPLALEGTLQRLAESAVLVLGRVNRVSTRLRDEALFLYAYVREEAVHSSRIEGTQSSLSARFRLHRSVVPDR